MIGGDTAVLVGAGIIGFILVYLFSKLGQNTDKSANGEDVGVGDNHVLLRVLILAVLLGCFLVIGATTVDMSKQNCDILINQTHDNTSNPQDVMMVYSYSEFCFDNDVNHGSTFYNIVRWFVYFVSIYLFGFLLFRIWVAAREGIFKRLGGGK